MSVLGSMPIVIPTGEISIGFIVFGLLCFGLSFLVCGLLYQHFKDNPPKDVRTRTAIANLMHSYIPQGGTLEMWLREERLIA